MDSNTLRARFLAYFEAHGHTVVPSSSLVPANDPTLLFTNAGMVQFKDVFLGREPRGYTRAVSSQRCVRAGGKHNDLENVGYTARHHTFFEMLGNFSFGDYFKRDAIRFAWEFVTGAEWLGIAKDRLLVTVYASDDEAYDIWKDEIGVPADRIVRIGDKPGGGSDNFWQMGDTGPCGPCSEIFYDHDPDGSLGIWGGPPGSPEEDGDRWIEIWNLVFMQFERAADGTLAPLPKPSVDTGLGLERICALMQGVHNNYDIDIFRTLIQAAASLAGTEDLGDASLKVVADHIRATSFLITDGVVPSNEGRGYVLRRIMRRAIRHGYKLGLEDAFFYKLVAPLAAVMGEAYPELNEKRGYLERVIRQEEDSFAQTLEKGMRLLEDAIAASPEGISGTTVFKLYDTYGFPVDLTADIARERNIEIDLDGFEREMQGQREQSRAASSFGAGNVEVSAIDVESEFTGYTETMRGAKVLAILRDGAPVEQLQAGESAVVFLDKTPFYAESGGQVGDTGVIAAPGLRFAVNDTRALKPGTPGHIGTLESGTLTVGDHVKAEIDHERRHAIMRNHSATHLLHAALRETLGAHVAQKGSLVAAERLRFDFSHFQAVTPEEILAIEDQVNRQVLANVAAETQLCGYQEAVDRGAIALFGEKYGDVVRVLSFGPAGNSFSTELCGGTHVARSGDIGLFKIVAEAGVAAGVRRIEAVTGLNALSYLRTLDQKLSEAAGLLKAPRDELAAKLAQQLDRSRALEKELAQAKQKLTSQQGGDLASQAQDVGGAKLLVQQVEDLDVAGLRGLMDQLKNKLGSGIVVLGQAADGKVTLLAGVTQDLTARLKAGELVNFVASQVGGKGGGRPDMAQAGGSEPDKLPAALKTVHAFVAGKLGA